MVFNSDRASSLLLGLLMNFLPFFFGYGLITESTRDQVPWLPVFHQLALSLDREVRRILGVGQAAATSMHWQRELGMRGYGAWLGHNRSYARSLLAEERTSRAGSVPS